MKRWLRGISSRMVVIAIFGCIGTADQAWTSAYQYDDLVTTIRSSAYLLTVRLTEAKLIDERCYRYEYALAKRHWGSMPVEGEFFADAPMTVGQTYAVFDSDGQLTQRSRRYG